MSLSASTVISITGRRGLSSLGEVVWWKYAQRLPEEVLASCSEASTDLDRGENLLSFFFKLVGQRWQVGLK